MNINHTTKTTSTGRLQTNLASGTILQNWFLHTVKIDFRM